MINKYFFYFILTLLFVYTTLFQLSFFNKPNLIKFDCIDIDINYESSLPTQYQKHVNLSIVIPFHIKQFDSVKKNIQNWNNFKPCIKQIKQNIQLYLYVGYLDQSTDYIDQEVDKIKKSDLFKCFSDFNIVKFKYSDQSLDKHVLGSRLMFEYMLSKKDNFFKNLTYVFYMEPDTRPIKPNWLISLVNQVLDKHFWIKGSLFRGDVTLMARNYLPSFFHINGNAIYNIGDNKFKDFYFNTLRPYVVRKHGDSFNAYDTDFFEYLLDIDNYKTTKDIFHLFQLSDFIQNHWHSEYNLTELILNNKNTYFVHGGYQSY